MRWLIALGLVVAACSGSGSDGPSSSPSEAGAGGEDVSPSGGKPGAAGASARAGAPARGSEGAGAGGREADDGGAAGAGGSEPATAAGQGGELVTPSGGSSTGSGGSPAGGSSGTAGTATGGAGGSTTTPDPCEGVLPWDPKVPYTEIKKDELRTLRGELWKCSTPAFCTTYPGNETAPGWVKVAECADPNEGGEPACQCAAGMCCDGCYFRPSSYFCGEVERYARCTGNPHLQCPGVPPNIERDYWNLFCTGDTGGDCTRWAVHTKYAGPGCDAGLVCVESGDQASCVACPN